MEEQAAAAAASAAADFVARSATSAPFPVSSNSPSDNPSDSPSDSLTGNGVLVTRHRSLEPPTDAAEVAAKAKSFGANRIRRISSSSLPSDRILSDSLPDTSGRSTDQLTSGSDKPSEEPSDRPCDGQSTGQNGPDTAASHVSKQTNAADSLLADRDDSPIDKGVSLSDKDDNLADRNDSLSDKDDSLADRGDSSRSSSDTRPGAADGCPKFNFGGVKVAIQTDDQAEIDEQD